jgi:hypothetical protein
MDSDNSKTLFDIVGEGDDVALQRYLLQGKERNIATLVVSDLFVLIKIYILSLFFFHFVARQYRFT